VNLIKGAVIFSNLVEISSFPYQTTCKSTCAIIYVCANVQDKFST